MSSVPEHPELLLRERAWLHGLARQLVRSPELADELAHDALSAAVMQASPLHTGPRRWLAAILKKQVAGHRRSEQRRRQREAEATPPAAPPPPFDTVAQFEMQRDVAHAVLALAEPYRTTVLLRFWEGLSPAAIARRMEVPIETVRTRQKRGLAQLRERLDARHGGDRAAWAVPMLTTLWQARSIASVSLTAIVLMTTLQKLLALLGLGVAMLLSAFAAGWFPFAGAPLTTRDDMQPTRTVVAENSAAETVPSPTAIATLANERDVAPAPIADVPFTVRGIVVDDATGLPLGDVAVTLTSWPNKEGDDVTTSTERDGSFALRDPRNPIGKNRNLEVRATDYAMARIRVPLQTEAAAVPEIDVGTLRLVRGTIYSGQVVAPDGRGVADARLLLPRGYGNASGMLEYAEVLGNAEADGRFRLTRPVGPDTEHGNLLFAITPRAIGWCRIEPSAQRREVDDLLIPLRKNGSLAITVHTPDGRPCVGATVRALPRFTPLGYAQGDWRRAVSRNPDIQSRFTGVTQAEGTLLLDKLPIGEGRDPWSGRDQGHSYRLWVEMDGFPTQPLHTVDVDPDALQRVLLQLMAEREVTVHVEVNDDLGKAIEGAVLEAYGDSRSQATSDAAGLATIRMAATQRLRVLAEAPGHRWAEQELDVGASTTEALVQFVLTRTQRLVGQVIDSAGEPVASPSLFLDNRHVGSADADGHFVIEDFPMGPQPLVVALPSGADHSAWIGEQSPGAVDAAHGPVTIVLTRRPGNTDVAIRIVDAISGNPLEIAQARLGLWIEVGGRGGYWITKHLDSKLGVLRGKAAVAGRWRLDVRTFSGQRGSLPFTIAVGQPALDLQLALPMPGTVLGRLQFVDVTPPAKVTLRVAHANIDATSFVQYRYPGTWHVDATSPSVAEQQNVGQPSAGTGDLKLQPALDSSFRLDAADVTDALVFTVFGEGVTGTATVRVMPSQTRELVIEVHAKH
ncbi:MAG: RNA polymerase sigma-70 factor (ECF subfamily) [Planctomycetota bacterium]|jgi:RNA polymerase sigma-70 factor (ECF subfamily)